MSWRTDDQEMARFHRETKKKNRFEGSVTNKRTDGATESTTKNSRLLAGAESTDKQKRQAGRRLDSAPVSDVVALATKVGPAGRLRW